MLACLFILFHSVTAALSFLFFIHNKRASVIYLLLLFFILWLWITHTEVMGSTACSIAQVAAKRQNHISLVHSKLSEQRERFYFR